MKNAIAFYFLSVLVMFGFSGFPAAAQTPKPHNLQDLKQKLQADIPNLTCLTPQVATAGQPNFAAFQKLAQNGFKSVINLRTATEGIDLKQEQEMAEKAGLKYISIPVQTSAPNPEQVPVFFAAVQNKTNQPMLIHCGSANRVGAFWLIYRVVKNGWTVEKAEAEAVSLGLTNPALKQFALDYIRSVKSSPKSE
ncbi:MAG: protein tyrosine phosphatase family protein [Blastocatellia bacterium]|nr:protein tyrosine phosphatase family protein [Blastocatellia bacterium]